MSKSVIMNPHEKLWILSAQVSNSILNFNACNFKNRKLLILNGYQPLFRILKNIPQYCHTLSTALKGQMNKKGGTPPQLMTKTEFLFIRLWNNENSLCSNLVQCGDEMRTTSILTFDFIIICMLQNSRKWRVTRDGFLTFQVRNS